MRVLVTGGAGFIGSHLVRELVDTGSSVVVLDDFSSGNIENLDTTARLPALRVVKGDIRNRNAVDDALRGVKAVVHLAGFVDAAASVGNPLFTHDVNVNGTLNLLNACVRNEVGQLVFASSAAVYGDNDQLPLKEDYNLRPLSPYAASKVSGEYYCKTFSECYGLYASILRFFNVYGPGQGNNAYAGVITKFLRSSLRGESLTIYGDGNQTRDFINVQDVVEAILKALNFKSSKSEVFNVCTGKATSINDLARSVTEILGKTLRVVHAKPREGDITHSYGDPSHAKKALRFDARVNFEAGLKRFVETLRGTP